MLSLVVLTGVAFAHGDAAHEEAQAIESLTVYEEAQAIGELQSVGGKAEYDAVQSGRAELRVQTGDVTADGRADVEVTSAPATSPSGVSYRFIWDSRSELGESDQMAAEVALEARAEAIAEQDPNVRSVEVRQDSVTVEYRRPAKLFGFIPVAYRHAFTLDGKGQLSHGRPWWLIFATDDAVDFELGVEAAFQHNQSNLDFLKLQDLMNRQSHALQTLSNVLKAQHEVAMNAIRNMR